MSRETIQYGIGKEYLSSWTIKDALREIFQNYIDYGLYDIAVHDIRDNKVKVSIQNDYIPDSYEFLQIGKSIKVDNAIGKHGEGLKMSFLIFLRENLFMQIRTQNKRIIAKFNKSIVGETLALDVIETKNVSDVFLINFICDKAIWKEFENSMICKGDIIFKDEYHGSIVNKEKGNLYSGGLFVCNLKNLKNAYDIQPRHLSLDRDRRIPSSWEVNWHTGKILEKQDKFNFVDQDYDDVKSAQIPERLYGTIKPINVQGKIEYVAKVINQDTNKEEEILIKSSEHKNQLNNSSFFKSTINKLKRFITSALGIDELLLNFRNKYCNSTEARQDFDIILEKLNIKIPDQIIN